MKTQEQVLAELKEMGNYDFNGLKFGEIMDSISFDITDKKLIELDRIYTDGDYTVMCIMNILKQI